VESQKAEPQGGAARGAGFAGSAGFGPGTTGSSSDLGAAGSDLKSRGRTTPLSAAAAESITP